MSTILTARPTPVSAPPAPRPGIEPELLADILEGLASVSSLWAPHVEHDPVERSRVRLLATAQYEIWLLGWCPGQHVELHDHGDSAAAFQVLQGDLVELRLEAAGLARHPLRVGATRSVPPGSVHDVVNVSGAVATSLHAYSPPLATMNFYGAGGARSETVEEVPAVYDTVRLARQVHPARRTVA
jgi:quercetin dioxygenase-like cupin family protein